MSSERPDFVDSIEEMLQEIEKAQGDSEVNLIGAIGALSERLGQYVQDAGVLDDYNSHEEYAGMIVACCAAVLSEGFAETMGKFDGADGDGAAEAVASFMMMLAVGSLGASAKNIGGW